MRIKIENLLLDSENPRYEPQASQRSAMTALIADQEMKLVNLAEDILDKGLNPSDIPLVTPAADEGTYVVLEGNRRVAALQLLSNGKYLESIPMPAPIQNKLKELAARVSDEQPLPDEIECAVVTKEEASHWIYLKHTGQNGGIGVVDWEGTAAARFRGSSPALQAIDLIAGSKLIDSETRSGLPKIAITNIERLLGTPEARKLIGVDVTKGRLQILDPEEKAMERLAMIIDDVAKRNIRVPHLDSKDQRIAYATEIANRTFQKPTEHAGRKTGPGTPTGTVVSTRRFSPVLRHTLIPKRLRLSISKPRIAKIFVELQGLRLDHYPNSASVLFRVFVEMSVEDFAARKHIPLKEPIRQSGGKTTGWQKDLTLREKIRKVTEFLEQKKLADRDVLRGIRNLTSKKNSSDLSVENWNAFVHNMYYTPTGDVLITNWDNVQPFIEVLYS